MTQRNAKVYEVTGPFIEVHTPFGKPTLCERIWWVRGHGGLLAVKQWGSIKKWDDNFTVTVHPADTHRSKTLSGIMRIARRLLREGKT